jgi:hypothetical protein
MGRRRKGRAERSSRPPPERYVGPPTVVNWEVDYSYGFPLVNRSPGVSGVDVLDAETLGLSPELGERLTAWAARWEDLAMRHVDEEPETDESRRDERQLSRDERTLVHEVHQELGDIHRAGGEEVELLVGGVPFEEWRHQ